MAHHDPHDPNCRCHLIDDSIVGPQAAARWSRRGLLTAAVAGVGAMGLARMGAVGAADRPGRLLAAGSALEPAERIPAPTSTIPDLSTTSTTSTTVPSDDPEGLEGPDGETVGPFAFDPPEEGRILFPIVVEDGDHCGVLDNFGETRGRPPPYYHQGVDIMADEGLPIRAVVNGILTRRSDTDFYGWTLYDAAEDVVYRYFHNTADANGFEEGDRVRQGDIIGFVGDTGTSVGNFHLHFEYRPGNVPADCFDTLQRVDHVLYWG